MARTNTRATTVYDGRTHGGVPVRLDRPARELRRAVLSCLLWEDNFYESGVAIHDRILALAMQSNPQELAELAVEARTRFNLRHVSLLLLTALVKIAPGRRDGLVRDTIASVIQRADEPAELLAMWWKDGKQKLPAQLKKGIAQAFQKFDAYQLAKYNRADAVKMRDAIFMTHAKPIVFSKYNDQIVDQGPLFAKLVNKEHFPVRTKSGYAVAQRFGRFEKLESPDTWEVNLSGGADKKETFERMLSDNKLGYLALLRNLRNMIESGVSRDLIDAAIAARKGAEKVFPFRFVAAARMVPQLEAVLDAALVASLDNMPQLTGETAVLVDVSGSMEAKLSGKSDLTRMDAAATLGSIIPGRCRVFTFSEKLCEVPPRKGMAGVEKIVSSQPHYGTALAAALGQINAMKRWDRIICITDEQSTDGRIGQANADRAYMINVAGYQPSVAYGNWVKIEGFSESVIRFINEYESDGVRD